MQYDERIHREEVAHNLRIYSGSNVYIETVDGNVQYGKLLLVDYDKQKMEYYALMIFRENAFRIYENEIDRIIPDYADTNDSVINSVRTILSEKFILWDSGVITNTVGKFPVVNIVNEGQAIRVDYCNDLSAEDVEFFELFKTPSVDSIVCSIERNFEKYAPKKKGFRFWRKG